eukprot:1453245-Heterocapsa_arctica.AAC.1
MAMDYGTEDTEMEEDLEREGEKRAGEHEDEGSGRKRPRHSTRVAEKRRRDAEHEREIEEEEYKVRGVSVVNLDGPPWYDEYTGEELPEKELNEAMQSERSSLEAFKMSRDADESEKNVPGMEIVYCRWLVHRKPATKKVKARLTARQ